MIKGTTLGRAVLEDVALWATSKERIKVPETTREMMMAMISKPGRDHSKVKGWRPIVLANTVGKLGEKLIGEDLQEIKEVWHERCFGGRKGRGPMDSVMLLAREKPGKKRTYMGEIYTPPSTR